MPTKPASKVAGLWPIGPWSHRIEATPPACYLCGFMPLVETSFPGVLDADPVGSLDAQTGYGAAESRWSNVCGGHLWRMGREDWRGKHPSGAPIARTLSTGGFYSDGAATDRNMDRALVQQLVRRKINDRCLPLGRDEIGVLSKLRRQHHAVTIVFRAASNFPTISFHQGPASDLIFRMFSSSDCSCSASGTSVHS